MAGESAYESARRQREKAERLLRSADLHEKGAEGERATAAVLATLPGEHWTVLHDVRWPGRRFANVDHVVIGPPGVFVVDSKNWSGRIEVRDQVLRQNGYKREPAVAGAAEAALAVARLVPLLRVDLVVPVLCFVRDEPVTGWARDVVVCSTSNLLSLLQSRPSQLEPWQVRDIALQLDGQLNAASLPAAEPKPHARSSRYQRNPSPVPRTRPRAPVKRKSRKSPAAELLRLLALLAALYFAYMLLIPSMLTR
ncbi:MAG: NERD domain-containing protein [Solirubrobacteraceae bacterium]|nr:NERD domain-containing protein [Solirubrobacteraceae bacterium]